MLSDANGFGGDKQKTVNMTVHNSTERYSAKDAQAVARTPSSKCVERSGLHWLTYRGVCIAFA